MIQLFILLFFLAPSVALTQSPGGIKNNLSFWLKADSGITETNDTISQWNDLAPNNLHVAVASTGNRPVLNADTINYYPAVFFNGTSPLLRRIGSNYNILVNAQGGKNVNTTGSLFTVASSIWDNGNIFSQYSDPRCGSFVLSADLSAGVLRMGGRSRSGGTFRFTNHERVFMTTALEAPGTNNAQHYLNGGDRRTTTNSQATVCTDNQVLRVGLDFRGSIMELISFDVKLADEDRRKIESYLAIKYGITINNKDGGSNGDYIAADGATVWDASNNSDYHNRVIAIGRDDSSALYQRQSHDADDNARIYLNSLAATNSANTGSFGSNKQFVFIADNNAAFTNYPGNNEYPADLGIVNRISREWKITNTGYPGNFSIDLKPRGGSYDASHIRILIDEDGDFSSGATMHFPTVSYNAGVLTLAGISTTMIPAGSTRYMAVVTITAPGGVMGTSLWIKANEGVYSNDGTTIAVNGASVTKWNDISGSNNHLAQFTNAEKPAYRSSSPAFNYNPVVQFSNNYLKSDSVDGLFINGQTYNDIHLYSVHYDSTAADFDWLYYEGNTPTSNRVSSSRDFPGGGNNANYSITTANSLLASTGTGIPVATTNIVGHHAGTAGNYGQASNRHTALVVNGKEVAASSSFSGYTVSSEAAFYLGDNESGNNDSEDSPFTGDIGEVIAFLQPLIAGERNRVESYLAIKYGKTLDNSAGGADGDYLSSDGGMVWDASSGSVYHNDVIGLIRDNSSGLLQKQSHQGDDSTRLYVSALATANTENTGTISQNLSSLLIGHNKGMLGETTTANNEIPAGSLTTSRLEREWKVTNTAFTEPFSMDIRLNSTGLGNINIANLALLVDDDGDFSNALIFFLSDGLSFTYTAGLLTVSGISTTMIPTNTTRYITIARIAVTPGGVAGVRVWAKADAGVYSNFGTVPAAQGEAVAQWNDFSGNNIHLFQTATAQRPSFVSGDSISFNYNPAIRFTNNYLKTNLGDGLFTNGTTYSDIHIYTVHHDLDANNFDWLYYEGSGAFTNRISASYNFSSLSNVDYDINTSNRIRVSNTNIPTGVTNIVGHQAGTAGNYGQANNRYGALMVNGREVGSSASSFSGYTPGSTSDFYLGDNETGNGDAVNNPFTGYIGELLVYVNPLSDTQRNQVESYLAIKYGKTLDNSAGGTDGDYLSSTNTTVWDASDGSAYHNNIIGIGRDDNSALNQRQSHLSSDSVRLYIGKLDTTNAANTGSFKEDEQFIMTGDNNAAMNNNSSNTEFPANVGILGRMDREWKITNSNFTGSFSMDIKPTAGLYDASKIRILVDDDGNFIDAALFTPKVTYINGVLTLSGITTAMVPVNSTRYLAVVTIASPGGVASSLWVKANDAVYNGGGSPVTSGQAVRHWIDLSGSNNHLTQATIDQRPLFRDDSANSFNYNPTLFFSNSSLQTFSGDGLFEQGMAYDNINIFTVHQDLNADDFNWLYHEGSYQNRVAAGYNFPGFATAFYNVSNHIAEEASTETDIPTNTVNIVGHYTGAAGNYGQANDKYRALVVNGREVAGNTDIFTSYMANTVSEFNVGNTTDGNEIFESPFAGYIGEIIVYKNALDTLQRHKIESYLAIKYGKTLDNSAGGHDGDYISSAATILWDASGDTAYHKQVIGIGRDDNSALLQKQSHTDDDTTRIYLSTLQATNKANTGNFNNDNSFLMVGNNGEPLFNTYGNGEFPPGQGIYSRIDREWKISNSNFTGSFSMDVKLNTTPVTAADLRVLIDKDGDFTDAEIYGHSDLTISYNSGIVTIAGLSASLIPVDSTRFLTIASINSGTPLPLRLLKFTAVKSNTNTIWLNWSTDEEINFSHFEIERSFNGTDWERIGIVQARGLPGVNRYQFEDRAPGQGINYYRLKMVDIDTDYEYSPVRLAGIFNQNNIAVYPNPVDGKLIIKGIAFKPGELQLYDITGRNLSNQLRFKATGSNVIIIDASGLISGVYLLKIQQSVFKIIKR